jgi:hypothetical protein
MSEPTDTAPDAKPPASRSLLQRLAAVKPSDLIILFFLCVLVGMLLAVLNVDPASLWVDFFGALADAWRTFFGNLGSAISWALQYFFLGAVIIVPIWLLFHVIRALSSK